MTNKAFCRRFLAAALAALMALPLSACGKGGSEKADSQIQEKKWAYVPEYLTLDEEISTYDCKLVGDILYYSGSDYNEETEETRSYLRQYSLADNAVVGEIPLEGDHAYINNFQVAGDGSLYMLYTTYTYSEERDADGYPVNVSNEAFLAVYDSQGQKVKDISLTGIVSEEEYVSGMAVDGEGRFYLALENSILLLDAEGGQKGKVELNADAWISDLGVGKDGRVYLSYNDYSAGGSGFVLAAIDFDGKKLGDTYENFRGGNSSGSGLVQGGEDYDFLVNDGSALHGYRLDTQTDEVLFSWIDCNINGNYVDRVGVMEDGRIAVMTRDWSTDERELALLSKVDASTVPEKQEVVIATYSVSQELETQIVNFNKQSDLYHVTVKDYSSDITEWTETSHSDAMAAMNSDLVSSDNAPDMIVLSEINVEQLAAKGVFEDLTPYLDKSSVLSKEDYLDNIIDSYTYSGVLVGIPFTFNLQTLVVSAKDLGEEPGWTLEEMIAYAKANPDAQLMDYATKSQVLNSFLCFGQDAYIDWANGTCSFDSDEFKELLEFVAQFPDEYDWSEDDLSAPEKILNGDLLIDTAYISEFEDIQVDCSVFEGGANFIGYPTSDGSNGCRLSASNGSALAIVSTSDNKDGAWAFMEYYLNRKAGEMFSWGFPSRKSDLDRMIAEATTVQYMTDENGEQVLDEEGNPIEVNTGGSISYNGSWEYEYHLPTEEEVGIIRSLMENAKLASDIDETVLNIITEEAEPFFQGQKSVDAVVDVIQSRIQLYIDENQ